MKSICTFLVISFLLFGNINAQITTRLADFPGSQRRDLITFSIGNKIYTGGGMNATKYLQDFWEYNTLNDVWIQKRDFPVSEFVGNAIVLNGYAYVCLGGNDTKSSKEWWQYDNVKDAWSRKADFPVDPGFDASFVSWNNEIYAIGVADVDNTFKTANIYNEIWKYNPSKDNWTLFDKFPGKPRHSALAVSFGNTILFGLGQNEASNEFYADLYSYNLETKICNIKASIPSGLYQPGGTMNFAGTYNNTLFLINTDYNNSGEEDQNKIYSYNMLTDQWNIIENKSFIPWRLFGLGATIDQNGYTGLGYDYISDIWYNDMWKIDLNSLKVDETQNLTSDNIKVNTVGTHLIIELPQDLRIDSTLNIFSTDGKSMKNISLIENTDFNISLLPINNYVWTIQHQGSILKSGKLSNIK